MRTKICIFLLSVPLSLAFLAGPARAERVGDLVTLENAAPIPVHGRGIVTGLAGTGDKSKAAQELLRQYLNNGNMHLEASNLSIGNIAFVQVSGVIPPFLRPAQRFEITVTSVGDAKSLAGGELLLCDLYAGRSTEPVARATGQVIVGQTLLTRGTIPVSRGGGALFADTYPFGKVINERGILMLNLNEANWADASNIANQLNLTPSLNPDLQETVMFAEPAPVQPIAWAKDAGQVWVRVPDVRRRDESAFIRDVLDVPVPVDVPARIVINRAKNTIVVSGTVKVSNVVVSLQDKTVTLRPETPEAPASYVLDPGTARATVEMDGPGTVADLQALVTTLNSMGLNTSQVIAMFEELHRSGAIKAELISQ